VNPDLRSRLAELIRVASDGELATVDVLGGGSLPALGLNSLGLLRLVDAVEGEFGVALEPGVGPAVFDTVETLAAHLDRLLPPPHDGTGH
jgi:acyl carrier protein